MGHYASEMEDPEPRKRTMLDLNPEQVRHLAEAIKNQSDWLESCSKDYKVREVCAKKRYDAVTAKQFRIMAKEASASAAVLRSILTEIEARKPCQGDE